MRPWLVEILYRILVIPDTVSSNHIFVYFCQIVLIWVRLIRPVGVVVLAVSEIVPACIPGCSKLIDLVSKVLWSCSRVSFPWLPSASTNCLFALADNYQAWSVVGSIFSVLLEVPLSFKAQLFDMVWKHGAEFGGRRPASHGQSWHQQLVLVCWLCTLLLFVNLWDAGYLCCWYIAPLVCCRISTIGRSNSQYFLWNTKPLTDFMFSLSAVCAIWALPLCDIHFPFNTEGVVWSQCLKLHFVRQYNHYYTV